MLNVAQGSPAAAAGIQGTSQWCRYQVPAGGDIIAAGDSQAVTDVQSLTINLEMETIIGEAVKLTLLCEGRELTIASCWAGSRDDRSSPGPACILCGAGRERG